MYVVKMIFFLAYFYLQSNITQARYVCSIGVKTVQVACEKGAKLLVLVSDFQLYQFMRCMVHKSQVIADIRLFQCNSWSQNYVDRFGNLISHNFCFFPHFVIIFFIHFLRYNLSTAVSAVSGLVRPVQFIASNWCLCKCISISTGFFLDFTAVWL